MTERSRRIIGLAKEHARRQGSNSIQSGHVLLAMLEHSPGAGVETLWTMGVDTRRLAADTATLLDARSPQSPLDGAGSALLELARIEARRLEHSYVGSEHLLLGLIRIRGSLASQVLRRHGVVMSRARRALLEVLRSALPVEQEQPADAGIAGELSERGAFEFDARARMLLAWANLEARHWQQQRIEVEHLLLAFCRLWSGDGASVLERHGIGAGALQAALDRRLSRAGAVGLADRLPFGPGAERIFHAASADAEWLGHPAVSSDHLLLAIVRESSGVAADAIRALGAKVERIRSELMALMDNKPRPQCAVERRIAQQKSSVAQEVLMKSCRLCAQVQQIGEHPSFIASLSKCHAFLGDDQGALGWCVLVLKEHVEHLAELDKHTQRRVFDDVARTADAIRAVFPSSGAGGGPPRINYECLGNLVPHIHWHIIPRHADDPDPTRPVWVWPEALLKGNLTEGERRALILRLRAALE